MTAKTYGHIVGPIYIYEGYDDMIDKNKIAVVCCVCKRMRTEDNEWVEGVDIAALRARQPVSDTYCPECEAKAHSEIDALEDERR